MKRLGLGLAVAAVLVYFLDPRSGAGRRSGARDRLLAPLRGRASDSAAEAPKQYDDVTLARKVETEIFRPRDAPKGTVDVNVQRGVVQLRGEVERPELIDELVTRARNVQGVRDVENLLHANEPRMHEWPT